MSILEVRNLKKKYPGFLLDEVSFSLEPGRIAGFIGRNGAGKTTTIKGMLNLIHLDDGEVAYFGMPLSENESEIKKRIGYTTGAVNWYPRKKIRKLAEVTKSFYDNWDDSRYNLYLKKFEIDDNKTPSELSEGMKAKCNLLMALSHKAEILILDEPTSGLDPFSRDELLDLFCELKKDGVSIFFSTHIISDIEKCADDIVYISGGKIIASQTKTDFQNRFAQPGENLEQIFLRLERSMKND